MRDALQLIAHFPCAREPLERTCTCNGGNRIAMQKWMLILFPPMKRPQTCTSTCLCAYFVLDVQVHHLIHAILCLKLSQFEGRFGEYHGGGFLAELDSKNALEIISRVEAVRWLDPKTRAVFFEFVAYRCVHCDRTCVHDACSPFAGPCLCPPVA